MRDSCVSHSTDADQAKRFTAEKLRLYDHLVCDSGLSRLDLAVAWLLLSRYLNRDSKVAWPSAHRLATDLSASVRGVRRARTRLVQRGWLVPITVGGHGPRDTSMYGFNFGRVTAVSPLDDDDDADDEIRVTDSSAKGDNLVPLRVTTLSAKGDTAVTQTLLGNPITEPIDQPIEPGAPDFLKEGTSEGVHDGDTEQVADADLLGMQAERAARVEEIWEAVAFPKQHDPYAHLTQRERSYAMELDEAIRTGNTAARDAILARWAHEQDERAMAAAE